MHALLRYPKSQRRIIAQEWARRSNAVQSAARMERGPDAETVRYRALRDTRGKIIAHGCVYSANGARPWQIVRSQRGRTNQVDLDINGALFRTGSLRTALHAVKSAKWRLPRPPLPATHDYPAAHEIPHPTTESLR
jgi:hypothetical protein